MALALAGCILACYLFLECAYSTLYAMGIVAPPNSLWILEDTGARTIQFDPILGFRRTGDRSRFARITFGEIEYTGVFVGNAQGFGDREDFTRHRTDARDKRIAVFGDSFTAAHYLRISWPDMVEDLAEEKRLRLQLLNFSVGGGGLANWWSIFVRFLRAHEYQIDAIVFAVFGDNLQRGFSIAETRGYSRFMFGRMDSWDPRQWPERLEEARPYLRPLPDSHIVSSETFEAALRGEWHPRFPRPWRPYVARKLAGGLTTTFGGLPDSRRSMAKETTQLVDPGQKTLITEIRDMAREASLPVLVVFIPSKDFLIRGWPPREDVIDFSSLLAAEFVDGGTAFAGLTEEEIRAHWFPHDGHWAQAGSDRFAHFMFEVLEEWIEGFDPPMGSR